MKTSRNDLALEIMDKCPPELLADHLTIATAIRDGLSFDEIVTRSDIDKWPDTYFWLKNEMA